MVGHGVDGKVSACQIFSDMAYELDLIWVSVVAVTALRPEGGNLIPFSFPAQQHRTMLDTGLVHVVRRKAGDDLLRQG